MIKQTLNFLFFLACFNLNAKLSAEEHKTKIYFGLYSDSINKNLKGLNLISDEVLRTNLLDAIRKAKHVDKADFALWDEGWLLAIHNSKEVKFYRVFGGTRPRNTVFPCKSKEKDGKYFLSLNGFEGLTLDFDTKSLPGLKKQ